jgi:hypothetical protein
MTKDKDKAKPPAQVQAEAALKTSQPAPAQSHAPGCKYDYYCATCGSRNVRRNADVVWNIGSQCWEIVAIYDSADCEDCGGETSLKEVPV